MSGKTILVSRWQPVVPRTRTANLRGRNVDGQNLIHKRQNETEVSAKGEVFLAEGCVQQFEWNNWSGQGESSDAKRSKKLLESALTAESARIPQLTLGNILVTFPTARKVFAGKY